MSQRITDKDLDAVVGRINYYTNSPETPYTKDSDGKYHANIGNYHIDHAYGGVSLHRMQSEGGSVTDVFSCGHVTKRELYNMMHAYLRGLTEVQS